MYFGSVGVLLNLIIDEPFQIKITLPFPLPQKQAKNVATIIIHPPLCSSNPIESQGLLAKKKIQNFFANLSKSKGTASCNI